MTVLTPEQETAAQQLVKLLDVYHADADEEGDDNPEPRLSGDELTQLTQAVRAIGEQLDAAGGFELMQAVGQRTQELSPIPRYLDFLWSGIGTWCA